MTETQISIKNKVGPAAAQVSQIFKTTSIFTEMYKFSVIYLNERFFVTLLFIEIKQAKSLKSKKNMIRPSIHSKKLTQLLRDL